MTELAEKINAILKAAKLPQDCDEWEIDRWYEEGETKENWNLGGGKIYFSLFAQIGCCGIGVVTEFNHRHLIPLLKIAEEIAKAHKFGMLLMTDINLRTRKAATKLGWKVIEAFVNPKTGNKVFMATKVIT